MNPQVNEILINGMIVEEVKQYYHVHCFTDHEGPNMDNSNMYLFIPKVVCRAVDKTTLAVQDWYVRKKNLTQYIKGDRRRVGIKGAVSPERIQQAVHRWKNRQKKC